MANHYVLVHFRLEDGVTSWNMTKIVMFTQNHVCTYS